MSGIAVSPYHSAGQWEHFRTHGYQGIYERYIKPTNPRKGDQVLWWYPFSQPRGAYWARQTRYEVGLETVAKILHSQEVEFMLYLPKFTSGDVYPFLTIDDQKAECQRMLSLLPASCGIIFDEGASTYEPLRPVIDEEAANRVLGTEPCRFTYNSWSRSSTFARSYELTSHYAIHKNTPECVRNPNTHTLIEHHPKPESWDTAAFLMGFIDDCKNLGYNWIVQAEPMVNNPTGVITLNDIDPSFSPTTPPVTPVEPAKPVDPISTGSISRTRLGL